MLYRIYGQTGKQVSVIGFGGMRFPGPQNPEANARLVVYAHRRGITYFDTAPYYCDDRSEESFGLAFKNLPAGTFYVSTKCGEADGAALRASLEKSLRRLGVPRIHFFHIWHVMSPEDWQARIAGGAVAAALQAKREGLIEHVVCSSHMLGDELGNLLRQVPEIEGVTLGYSAINFPFRQAAVDAAGALKRGVVTMNPLAGGIIPQHAARFDFLRGPRDRSVVEAAIRFNISQPAITCALVGFSDEAQIDAACAATEGFAPYEAGHVAALRARAPQAFDGLCTGCGYCLPCPAGVAIPKLMDSYNHRLLQAKPGGDAIGNRLKWHWGLTRDAAKACTLCGACETKCTQHLPIRERLEEIAKIEK